MNGWHKKLLRTSRPLLIRQGSMTEAETKAHLKRRDHREHLSKRRPISSKTLKGHRSREAGESLMARSE